MEEYTNRNLKKKKGVEALFQFGHNKDKEHNLLCAYHEKRCNSKLYTIPTDAKENEQFYIFIQCVFIAKYPGENTTFFPLYEEIQEIIADESAKWCNPLNNAFYKISFSNYRSLVDKIPDNLIINLVGLKSNIRLLETIEDYLKDINIEDISFIANYIFLSLLSTNFLHTFHLIKEFGFFLLFLCKKNIVITNLKELKTKNKKLTHFFTALNLIRINKAKEMRLTTCKGTDNKFQIFIFKKFYVDGYKLFDIHPIKEDENGNEYLCNCDGEILTGSRETKSQTCRQLIAMLQHNKAKINKNPEYIPKYAVGNMIDQKKEVEKLKKEVENLTIEAGELLQDENLRKIVQEHRKMIQQSKEIYEEKSDVMNKLILKQIIRLLKMKDCKIGDFNKTVLAEQLDCFCKAQKLIFVHYFVL